MKKAVLIILLLTVLVFSLLAVDISAKTFSGRTVILHDDGTWEYKENDDTASLCIGKWEMKEADLDALIDEYLAESGIDSTSATYSFYKTYMKELVMQELHSSGVMSVITLDIAGDGTCTVSSGDDSIPGTYTLGDDRVINVTVGDEIAFSGVFDESFKKLTIGGEEFFFLTKSE